MPFVKHGNKIHDLTTLNKERAAFEDAFNYAVKFASYKPRVVHKSKFNFQFKCPFSMNILPFEIDDFLEDDVFELFC